ncbi:MAG: bifunctional 2-polyprenyl-6-hydroxyphenol methylase/3-demethylubiquinol 3-O-methyltransferase UbiG [Bdellovibrionales bacterium]|jgi:2-polyprenyl-6-hydroxyphenyl methylase/3-demethylubiquinone-9 3-methyltransferase
MSTAFLSSVCADDVERFSAQAHAWWNPHGPFRILHDLMPLRTQYVCNQIDAAFLKKKAATLSVLDIGCGGGLMAEAMATQGYHVVGIDASPEAIEIAKDHAHQAGLSIDYRQNTAEGLAQAKERFDVILALEIVEHVPNIKSFMTAVSTLLKPNGLVIVATMNRTKRSFLLGVVAAEYILGWIPAGTHDWDHFVKPSELAALWEEHSIKPLDCTGFALNPLSRHFAIRKEKTAINYFMTGKKQE